MKSSRVSRVVQILTTLQTGMGYSTEELCGMFGVSRRTLFRDLKEMEGIGIRPQCVPLHPDNTASAKGEQCRYMLRSEQFLPPVNLNLQEALALLLLVRKMRGQIQLPFKNAALLAAMKLESGLPPRVRNYCEHALSRISTKASPQASSPKLPGIDNIFSTLQSAIAQRRKVRMRYDSLFDGEIVTTEFSPYHLFYNQRAWYAVGRSSIHKSARTFKLNRVLDAVILDENFKDGEDFDLAEYLGRAWSMIPEGRLYNVRLRFTPKVANNVAEVHWHDSQKVTRYDDGSASIDFRVDGLNEITWWVLGYGDQVEVLAPAALRAKIAGIAKNMTEINSPYKNP